MKEECFDWFSYKDRKILVLKRDNCRLPFWKMDDDTDKLCEQIIIDGIIYYNNFNFSYAAGDNYHLIKLC